MCFLLVNALIFASRYSFIDICFLFATSEILGLVSADCYVLLIAALVVCAYGAASSGCLRNLENLEKDHFFEKLRENLENSGRF